MGLFDKIKDFGFIKDLSSGMSNYADSDTDGLLWYQNPPYCFQYSDFIFPLPISPSNLSIETHFANTLIPTLYGTIEEHSDTRYFDIMIVGTTAIAPKYYQQERKDQFDATNGGVGGRQAYSSGAIKLPGGFASKTIDNINKLKNQITSIINPPKFESGVFLDNNGYVAFHNFYKFLLKYKLKINNGNGEYDDNGLYFLNYKDNQSYKCIVNKFILERNSDNPMLYNYSIQLRAYNLTLIGEGEEFQTLQQRMQELGLMESDVTLSKKFKSVTSGAKSAINSLKSTLGGLGR